MALTPVNDCLVMAAGLLRDPQQTSFDNATLWPFFGQGYTELRQLMMNWDLQAQQIETLYTLAANTSSLTPAVAGLGNFGEPTRIWEKPSGSSENYLLVEPADILPQVPASTALRWYKYKSDTFFFVPATGARSLKFEYSTTSDTTPSPGDTVPIDGASRFLGTRTASLVMLVSGMSGAGAALVKICFGPSGEPDGTGGLLRLLVNPMLKEKQHRPAQPQAFRPRTQPL